MLVLKADQSRGREKLYCLGRKEREANSTGRWNKSRSARKREWKKMKSSIKVEMQLQNILVRVTLLYLNWEKFLWYSKNKKIKVPHLSKVSENIGFAFVALEQRVLLVPGLKATSTFNLHWGKGASPHSNFLRSKKKHFLARLKHAFPAKMTHLKLQKVAMGICTVGENGACNWCVGNHEPAKLWKWQHCKYLVLA